MNIAFNLNQLILNMLIFLWVLSPIFLNLKNILLKDNRKTKRAWVFFSFILAAPMLLLILLLTLIVEFLTFLASVLLSMNITLKGLLFHNESEK